MYVDGPHTCKMRAQLLQCRHWSLQPRQAILIHQEDLVVHSILPRFDAFHHSSREVGSKCLQVRTVCNKGQTQPMRARGDEQFAKIQTNYKDNDYAGGKAVLDVQTADSTYSDKTQLLGRLVWCIVRFTLQRQYQAVIWTLWALVKCPSWSSVRYGPESGM